MINPPRDKLDKETAKLHRIASFAKMKYLGIFKKSKTHLLQEKHSI